MGYGAWTEAKSACMAIFAASFVMCLGLEQIWDHLSEAERPTMKRFRQYIRLAAYTLTTSIGLLFVILDSLDGKPEQRNLSHPRDVRVGLAFAIAGFFMYELAAQPESRSFFNWLHHGGLILCVLTIPSYYTVLIWFLALNEAPGVIDIIGALWFSDKSVRIPSMVTAALCRTLYLPVSLIPIGLLMWYRNGFHWGPAMIVIGGVSVHWVYYVFYMMDFYRKLFKETVREEESDEEDEGDIRPLLSGIKPMRESASSQASKAFDDETKDRDLGKVDLVQ